MPEVSAEPIALEVDPPIAMIVVNRADVRNALDAATWRQLADRLDEVAERPGEIRVALLKSAGRRAFVAGADIKDLQEITERRDASRRYIELVESVMMRLERLPQPIIAVASGDAVGAGLELMAACDLRVTQIGARFGIPAARLGLAITGQDLHRLERLIGLGRVKWLMFTAQLIDAEAALNWGLVDAVHEQQNLDQAASDLARLIAANSSVTHRLTKDALRKYTDPARQGDEEGFACSLPAWSGQSLAEGIEAFVARRAPDFPGVERSGSA